MILGIESSCDESALALFDPRSGMVGEWIHSQIALHGDYGGVVPDLASREHLTNFPVLLETSGLADRRDEIERIAVTRGPGLAGCLALGMALAKSLAVAWEVPVIGVNHLRGHAYSPFIDLYADDPPRFGQRLESLLPHLGLLVSGGNTILYEIRGGGEIEVLGETVDDAAGEALDKGAKLLGLPYPGGPHVEELAERGNPEAYAFPMAIAPRNERRFSFSGLKTSLRYRLEKMGEGSLETELPDLCASYQRAVIGQLRAKTKHVLENRSHRSLGLSGGVAKNRALRSELENLSRRFGLPFQMAGPEHTGDNAGMIAFAAHVDAVFGREGETGLEAGIEPALRLDAATA